MFCTSFIYRKEKTNEEEEETSYQINRALERPLNEYKKISTYKQYNDNCIYRPTFEDMWLSLQDYFDRLGHSPVVCPCCHALSTHHI